MYKITIEGGEFTEPVVFSFDKVSVSQEQGIVKIYERGGESFGRPVDLKLNGQRRLLLKAWSGCYDYDCFTPSEEVTF